MLKDKVLSPDAGLREPDQPVLLSTAGRQVRFRPGRQLLGHERLLLEVWVGGVVRKPGIYRERGLDYRQVVLVLRVEPLQDLEPVAELVTQPSLDREHEEEIMRHTGSRVRRLQDPQHLGT